MDRNEIKEKYLVYLKIMKKQYATIKIKHKDKPLYNAIIETTNYLPDEAKFNERTYHILNNLFTPPNCKYCGKELSFNKKASEYRIYCSTQCSNKDPDSKKKKIKTTLERYGVDNVLKLKNVREKRKLKQKKKIKTIVKKCDDEHIIQIKKEPIHPDICVVCPKEVKKKIKNFNLENYNSEFNIQPEKNKNQFKYEIFLLNYLRKILPAEIDIHKNTREIIKNPNTNISMELDFYIPEKNTAIEFNGLYWHSEKFKDKKYHIDKLNACKKKGIKLIQIFEDELFLKPEIVKNRIKNLLGVNTQKRVFARKCEIREIEPKVKNIFLEAFHVQGKDSSTVKLGAFYNNDLVSVMTFSKGNISKGEKTRTGVYELNRFCSNYNYHVIGIAGKLLKHFQRNYEWEKIYSYADLRWSEGHLYETLGFDLESQTQINYWYIRQNEMKRIHRFSLRKRPDEQKDVTERELRLKEGFIRIYDCGNLKYVMEK